MTYILERIELALNAGGRAFGGRFVFPSEVIAASWAREIAVRRGVVDRRRFISWGSFREEVFFGTYERRPANGLFRQFFAEDFLKRNARNTFLTSIVPVSYAENVDIYLPSVVQSLPHLQPLFEVPTVGDILGEGLLKDLALLCREYSAFLERYSRYEPSWEEKLYTPDGNACLIFFPELIEDFEDYFPMLKKNPDIVCVRVLEAKQKHGRIFKDYRQEIVTVLGEVALLLQNGSHPEDICISIPDFDSVYPRLEYYAGEMGIPLIRRSGKPLIQYASVSWLKNISELRDSSYSFQAMRRFLKNPGLPWKNPKVAAELLEDAVDQRLVEGGRQCWQLLISRRAPSLQNLFDDLESIFGARDFSALYLAMQRFIKKYLNSDEWKTEDESAWQRCVAKTKEIQEVVAEFRELDIEPFPLLLRQLESSSCQIQQDIPGISVFEYRVAAGIHCRHHFVINLNADATVIPFRSVPFIREDLLRKLFDQKRDSSLDFYRAYEISGENVAISCSRSTASKAVTPASILIYAEEIRGLSENQPQVVEAAHTWRPWAEESLQLASELWEGFSASQSARIMGMVDTRVSVTALETYIQCPLSYFWSRLRLESIPLHPDTLDYGVIGTAFHHLMECLYNGIAEIGGNAAAFVSSNMDVYKKIASAEIARLFGADKQKYLSHIPRYRLPSLRADFTHAVASILKNDASLFDGFSIYAVEMSVEREFSLLNGRRVLLRGKIDRIMQDPADMSFALVDYKSNVVPTVRQVLGALSDHLPGKSEYDPGEDTRYRQVFEKLENPRPRIQLPAYALLLGDQRFKVCRMGYYGVKNRSGSFGGAYTSIMNIPDIEELQKTGEIRHQMLLEILQGTVLAKTGRLLYAISTGDFRNQDNICCENRYKSVCRDGFAVRMRQER